MRRKLAPPYAFHIDVCLGGRFLRDGLQLYLSKGEQCRTHTSAFPQDTHDDVWLPQVGTGSWVVLSSDSTMLLNGSERGAIVKHSLVVVFYPTDLSKDMSVLLVGTSLAKVRGHLQASKPPFALHVSAKGEVRRKKL